MNIIPLSEGAFTIDSTKQFVPFDPQSDDLQQRPKGSLLVEIQPFLVVTKKDIILLDAGLGYTHDGVLQIHTLLAEHGYAADDVTKVLLSHLHRDHAGGISMRDQLSGIWRSAFPHAHHYVHRSELHFANSGQSASYEIEPLQVLHNTELVTLLDDAGVIDGYIHHQLTAGHSPFHQVFWIMEEDETVFFGGDEAPQLQQMKTKFIAKYDYNGKLAMEWRQQWWVEAQEKKWTILFYHDIATPWVRPF